MKQAMIAYMEGRINRAEMYRYQELCNKLIGNNSFVEVDDTSEWEELNELTRKING